MKDGVYAINFDKHKSIETHWMALYFNEDNGKASYDTTFQKN